MRVLALVLSLGLAISPGEVEGAQADVRGWLIDLRGASKSLRVAAQLDDLKLIDEAVARVRSLETTAGLWPMASVNGLIAKACRDAVNTLGEAGRAAKTNQRNDYVGLMKVYTEAEDGCNAALNQAVRAAGPAVNPAQEAPGGAPRTSPENLPPAPPPSARRELVERLQHYERLIAVAVQIGDRGALRRVAGSIDSTGAELSRHSDREEHRACHEAARELWMVARSLERPSSAERIVATQDALGRYLVSMPLCETDNDVAARRYLPLQQRFR